MQPDEASVPCIFIGCLPIRIDHDELFQFFAKHANIDRINIKRRKNGKGCGFGYLFCKDMASYNSLLSGGPYVFRNRKLVVTKFVLKRRGTESKFQLDERRVKLNNISSAIKADQIRLFLSSFGSIERLQINDNTKTDPKAPKKMEVRVTFKTVTSANKLLNSRDPFLSGVKLVSIK